MFCRETINHNRKGVFLMESIIQHFIEVCVKEIEKSQERFYENKDMAIGEFILELAKPLQEIQRRVVAEAIEAIDQIYRESSYRKGKYIIEHSNVKNSFISTCGVIHYQRTYFQNKITGEYVYLADEACGITPNMRKSEDVVVEAIKHVVDSSYRISGEHATNTDDVISKQAIMKDIHNLEVPAYIPKIKEKKQVKVLYINADEDHVSLQFNQTKGDLKRDKNGRKINNIEPRLVCVFEGIEQESENSKRRRLTHKHYIAGIYKDSEAIWEEVLKYIDTVYDENHLEKVYIMGDGAAWIKTGVEVIGAKSCFVLDKFHLNQSIMKAIGHLGDSVSDARDRIYDGISMEEKEEVMGVLDIASDYAETPNKKEQVRKTRVYIQNHWEGIIRPNTDEDARMGCSAEGQVSHLLSSRLSSRPLGWSKKGADNVARLRAYVANGGEVYDLIKYKKDKQERQIQEEIRKEVDLKIRKRQKTYTEVWNHETVAGSTGLVNGMYCLTKKLRGICG